MKLGLVGVGQGGGKIVDAFLEYQRDSAGRFITSVTAINTARADLQALNRVPEERRTLVGQSRVRGRGVGADNDLGADIAAESRSELLAAVEGDGMTDIDAFLVVAALGGGTGSGMGPLLVRYLSEVYAEPVYALGVLPGRDEGGIYTLNAARSFKTFVREADNVLVFDNDAWRQSGETLGQGYADINEEIARRFGVIFSAGEFGAGDTVAETVLDASEVINTLDAGGISTVGYASTSVESSRDGLLGWLRNGDTGADEDDTSRITALTRQATHGRLTMPCDVRSAERAALLVAGPPERLSRTGIESARTWLEEETGTMEVRGGDYPVDEGAVAVVVLLSGITTADRIEVLQRGAVENQENREERASDHEQRLADLLDGDDRTVDPLF
jgi:cell division GTPase FtsZ